MHFLCCILGFLFIFFTVFSFIWLAILCFDLLYKIKFFRENEQKRQRFYWYITIALTISLAVLLTSLFSGENFVPDVPSSFVKGYGGDKCEFLTSTSRIFIFFSPMVASFLTCIVSLSLIPYYFRKNEKNHKNEFDWVENKNNYKFLSTSYTILVAVSCFWLINVVFNFLTLNIMTQLALDVIEASLGMVTISIFIFNKYTMREIKEKIYGRKPKYVTEESLELNGYRTPITPRTPASDISEPMFPNANGDTSSMENSNRTFNTFHV